MKPQTRLSDTRIRAAIIGPLKGEWKGARSSYLTRKWRVLYMVEGDRFEVLVLEVNPHEY